MVKNCVLDVNIHLSVLYSSYTGKIHYYRKTFNLLLSELYNY